MTRVRYDTSSSVVLQTRLVRQLNTMVIVKTRTGKDASSGDSHADDPADVDAFRREMADVIRLGQDPRGRIRTTPPVIKPATPPGTAAEGSEEGDFTADGIDRRELKKLKRGDFPVDDRLDLHGMTAAHGCTSVRRFLENSRHARHRCVCIVHGRGVHSEANAAILKPRVRAYLRSQRSVLAFTDAPRNDGGGGAVYVLLRRG
jgi:DNA-nicking Smr family endonuclease